MEKPVIGFLGYRIESIDFKTYEKEDFEALEFEHGNVEVWMGFSEDYKQSQLKLRVTVLDENLLRSMIIEVAGQFELNCEREKAETYVSQNGTAILFPYVRAIASMISSLDNKNTIVLPTINTSDF